MLWLPTAKVDVVNVAFPVPSNATAAPSDVPPFENDTVPDGTVVPEAGVTVAVNVTDCPEVEGFKEEIRPVVVVTFAAALTVCRMPEELAGAKLESPL